MLKGTAGFGGFIQQAACKSLEFRECAFCGMEGFDGKVQLLAVAPGDEGVAHRHWTKAFCAKIIQRVEVAEAFGHFGTINHEVGAVKPVLAKWSPMGAFRLRDFVFVVREAKIDPAAMQIKDGSSKTAFDHGRTLHVPTGTTLAPRTAPEIVAIFLFSTLPQRKITDGLACVFVRIIGLTR